MKKQKKILIWEVNWLGDVIFSTPFISVMRRNYPDAYIACAVVPRCRGILEANPNIDEVNSYDEKGISKGFFAKLFFILKLKKRGFDTVFLLKDSLSRTIIAWLAGIKTRVGHDSKRNHFLTHPTKTHISNQHRVEDSLALERKMGIDTANKGLEFYYTEKDSAVIDDFFVINKITNNDKVIAINPGGNWTNKRWDPANWAKLCDMLIEKYGVKIIFSGAPKDVDLYLIIQDMMKNNAYSFCGKTTIRQVGALFNRCDLIISADSGPLHIACALQKKIIALFGPTDPKITGLYDHRENIVIQKDVKCNIPCYKNNCINFRCMKAISAEDVMAEVNKLL